MSLLHNTSALTLKNSTFLGEGQIGLNKRANTLVGKANSNIFVILAETLAHFVVQEKIHEFPPHSTRPGPRGAANSQSVSAPIHIPIHHYQKHGAAIWIFMKGNKDGLCRHSSSPQPATVPARK